MGRRPSPRVVITMECAKTGGPPAVRLRRIGSGSVGMGASVGGGAGCTWGVVVAWVGVGCGCTVGTEVGSATLRHGLSSYFESHSSTASTASWAARWWGLRLGCGGTVGVCAGEAAVGSMGIGAIVGECAGEAAVGKVGTGAIVGECAGEAAVGNMGSGAGEAAVENMGTGAIVGACAGEAAFMAWRGVLVVAAAVGHGCGIGVQGSRYMYGDLRNSWYMYAEAGIRMSERAGWYGSWGGGSGGIEGSERQRWGTVGLDSSLQEAALSKALVAGGQDSVGKEW